MLATAGRTNHQRVDRLLGQGVPTRALADKKPLRAASERERSRINERVIQDQVRGTQASDRSSRQQPGDARASADQ